MPKRTGWAGVPLLLAALVCAGAAPAGGNADDAAARARPLRHEELVRQSWEWEYDWVKRVIDHARGRGKPFTGDPRGIMRLLKPSDVLHPSSLILPDDGDPLTVALRRTVVLLGNIAQMRGAADLSDLRRELDRLKAAEPAAAGDEARKELYYKVRRVQRRIAFANPLLDFDRIAFSLVTWGMPHMVKSHYSGVRGTEVVVLHDPFSDHPRARDLLAEATIANGPLKGKRMGKGTWGLDLSHDGRRLVFRGCADDKRGKADIFTIGVDGSDLRQITNDGYVDTDPCFLPDGRIVFASQRRGGKGRCGVPPTFTLHSMRPDGADLIRLSYHETNEWSPRVDTDGRLVYSRWDYIDRSAIEAHHLWTCHPDGRDPRGPHGNYPPPYTVIPEAAWANTLISGRGLLDRVDPTVKRDPKRKRRRREPGLNARPNAEVDIRPIPGRQGRYIATAMGHHTSNWGTFILIDLNVRDDDTISQIKRITPEVAFPEAETHRYFGSGPYFTAFPLDENHYLCSYDPLWPGNEKGEHCPNAGCLYLIDAFGNRQFLFMHPSQDTEKIRDGAKGQGRARRHHAKLHVGFPIPVKPRSYPRVPVGTWQGRRAERKDHRRATMAVMNCYDSDLPWPKGTSIRTLRVVQVFPLSDRGAPNDWCVGEQSLARMSLGVVPVEADGSAYFEAPVGKEVYFQVLDGDLRAIQSMRSGTFVHPGEQLTCQGCHENKWKAPRIPSAVPLALRRAPSRITPDICGLEPLTYREHIKPIIQNTCVACHKKTGGGPKIRDRRTKKTVGLDQAGRGFFQEYGYVCTGGENRSRGVGGSRSVPGFVGSGGSRLGKIVNNAAHRKRIGERERKLINLWLDLAMPMGAKDKGKAEDKTEDGRIWWAHWLDSTPDNPLGIERDRPAP